MQNDLEINSSFAHRVSNIKNRASSFKNRASSFITYILSFVLLFSGITKIIEPSSLIENLSSVFPFLPETIIILISSLLPLLEIGLGVLLFFGGKGIGGKGIRAALISTAVLFGIFFLYSVYGFILGNQSDCGCFGNIVKSSFGWGMIVRNGVLVIISLIVLKNSK